MAFAGPFGVRRLAAAFQNGRRSRVGPACAKAAADEDDTLSRFCSGPRCTGVYGRLRPLFAVGGNRPGIYAGLQCNALWRSSVKACLRAFSNGFSRLLWRPVLRERHVYQRRRYRSGWHERNGCRERRHVHADFRRPASGRQRHAHRRRGPGRRRHAPGRRAVGCHQRQPCFTPVPRPAHIRAFWPAAAIRSSWTIQPRVLILSGSSNSYTGGTYIEEGTLEITSAGGLPAGSALSVGADDTLIFGSPLAGGSVASTIVAVPEPSTLALIATGIVLLAGNRLWRRK